MQAISKPSRLYNFSFWFLFIAVLSPWAWLAAHMAVNSDIIWLCTGMRRLLAGQTMSMHIYDDNPPFSLFTGLPYLLVQKITGMALHHAITFLSMAYIAISAFIVARLLRPWHFLNSLEIFALTAGYILAETILCSNTYIGERDQLISLTLTPFVLVQLALTFRLPCAKKMQWPVLAVGAIVILLKPHHGLLTTLLILHRAIIQRRWSVIRDPDFLCLAAATILYAVIIRLFFLDYLTVIFPDALSLYASFRDPGLMRQILLLISIAIVPIALTVLFEQERAKKYFILFFFAAALLSLVPYYVQGRAYYYQLFPAIGFFGAGLGLLSFRLISTQCKPAIALFLSMIFLTALAYATTPPIMDYPTHTKYANFPLTRLIRDCDGKGAPCSFFMFNKSMGIIQETAYYADEENASRFPSDWFLLQLLRQQDLLNKNLPASLSADKINRLQLKYSQMTAEDLAYYKPQLAFIAHIQILPGKDFDFVQYFSHDKDFRREWAHYKKTGVINLNAVDYYSRPVMESNNMLEETETLDIYKRISP